VKRRKKRTTNKSMLGPSPANNNIPTAPLCAAKEEDDDRAPEGMQVKKGDVVDKAPKTMEPPSEGV
jgi:hypothetical protein